MRNTTSRFVRCRFRLERKVFSKSLDSTIGVDLILSLDQKAFDARKSKGGFYEEIQIEKNKPAPVWVRAGLLD